jgi:hypothetical protein
MPRIDLRLEELIEDRAETRLRTMDYEWKATPERFKKAVRDFEPHIIHFTGHGRAVARGGQLAFVQPGGAPDWVDDRDFASWVAESSALKLVFLQACESALPDPYVGVSGVARAVAALDIPAVVAMQYKVESQVANSFACRFYEELVQGGPVDVAAIAGRDAIMNMRSDLSQYMAFGLPVVYLKGYEGMIVQAPGESRADIIPPSSAATALACWRCERPVSEDSRFCGGCGARLLCEREDCSARIEPTGNFCKRCGQEVHRS